MQIRMRPPAVFEKIVSKEHQTERASPIKKEEKLNKEDGVDLHLLYS